MSFVESLYEPTLEPCICTLILCESVAWLINNGPHSAACGYKLGPNRVKAGGLWGSGRAPGAHLLLTRAPLVTV